MPTLQLGRLRHREAGYRTTDTLEGCEAGILQPIYLLSKLVLCNAPLAYGGGDVLGGLLGRPGPAPPSQDTLGSIYLCAGQES